LTTPLPPRRPRLIRPLDDAVYNHRHLHGDHPNYDDLHDHSDYDSHFSHDLDCDNDSNIHFNGHLLDDRYRYHDDGLATTTTISVTTTTTVTSTSLQHPDRAFAINYFGKL